MSLSRPVDASVLLRSADWQSYVALRDEAENRHIRMTFDRGCLELTSPGKLHMRLAGLIGRCIDVWTEKIKIPMQGCRSTTFRREDLLRGLEPDNCYYIANEGRVRDREEVDLLIDPPPDLAIEVDVKSSSLDRMGIYAALGVPEVWRWRDEEIGIFSLTEDGKYVTAESSGALPGFPFHQMTDSLSRRTALDETSLIVEFRNAVREFIREHQSEN